MTCDVFNLGKLENVEKEENKNQQRLEDTKVQVLLSLFPMKV